MADRLTPMLTFVRIVEAGSLSGAARAMDRSLPAVCRSLAMLEERLGQRLLVRSTRRMALTEAGADFYERSRRIAADVEEAEAAISARRQEPQGLLGISAPVLFGRLHVAPAVGELLSRHPKVSANLLLADRNVNLVDEGLDVAIRIGTLPDSGMVARPLGRIPRVVCAAPAYLKRQGVPRHPRDLVSHHCVRFTGVSAVHDWTFAVDGAERNFRIGGRAETNDGGAAIEMAARGLGLVAVLAYQVQALLASGALVRVLRKFEPAPRPVHALYPSGRLAPAKLKVFLEILEATVAPALAKL